MLRKCARLSADHARGRGYRCSVACRGMGGRCSDGLLSRVTHAAERGPSHSWQAGPANFVGGQGNLAGGSIDRLLHDRDLCRFPVRHPVSGIAEALETLTRKPNPPHCAEDAASAESCKLRRRGRAILLRDPSAEDRLTVPELTRNIRIKLNRRVSLRSQPKALA